MDVYAQAGIPAKRKAGEGGRDAARDREENGLRVVFPHGKMGFHASLLFCCVPDGI
jgi:hypothetical protein